MKKIFTLLMAFSIALCTMAGSTFSVAERIDLTKVSTPKMEKSFTPVEKTSKAVRMDKQEARQAMAEARQAKTVAPVAVKGVRQIEAMPVATAQKQVLPVVNNKQRAAAQVTEATDTVEIVATTWVWKYYESDNDWYTTLIDATETYEFKLDYVSDTQAGTFTEDDCLMDYTGLYIYDAEGNRSIVTFTEVDIVVTDENGLTLHAELLGTDNVLYVVDAYIAPLPEPKSNVELAYVNAELVDATLSSSAFQFSAFENNYYTSIFIYSDQVEGEYETIDMYDPYYNYIAHVDGADTTFVDFLDLHAVVTKEGKTYNLVADVLGSDTIMYHITMSYTKPDPTDTIDIVATNLYIDEFEFWGMVFTTASASNDEYEVTFDLSIALEEGEYVTEDFNASYCGIVRTADMAEIAMTEISATVTGEGGDRVIKAEVVGSDNVLYNMDLSYVVPEATDTVQVVFDELASAEYYSSSADYYIVNQNENYIVTLDIFEEKGNLMGEYSVEDFDLYYTQLGVINGDTTVVTIADAKAVVTPVEEGIVLLEAELLGMDAVLYKVTTKVDVAEKGLQYDATEGFLMDEYTTEDLYTINDQSANGYIMFDVESADGNDLMGLVFWVDEADENTIIPTGTYQINGSTESGTVLASTGMGSTGLTYSLYATLDAEGMITPPCWFMVGGEVVVSENDGILSIYVDAVNSNNLPIFITCEYDLSTKQGLQYDMTEGSVERTYSDADIVEINTDYVAQYGELYMDIMAADGSDMVSLAFFVEETDDEIGIPEGVYPIDNSGEYGTVFASPGVMDGSIYPSFYGVLSPTGGIVPPCYFMVEGQVVVENVNGALKVTIDALNSYDVPAHIVYGPVEEEPVYEYYEDVITNLVIDYDNMLLIGGPSEAFQVEVVLGLGDYDRNTDNYVLLPESSISVLGSEATFVEGYTSVDGIAQTANAVVRCEWNGMMLEFHLTMSATPMEATVVVVENATVEIEKYIIFGDMYDYALKMTGNWYNEADGLTYPVLVEVPVYYPEATEAYEILSTVTVGGWGDEDPWLGFGEGYLTVTQEGDMITVTGIVENPMAGTAIDITISGSVTPTAVENAIVTVKPAKTIKNGQLIIVRDGKEYNAQGAVLK